MYLHDNKNFFIVIVIVIVNIINAFVLIIQPRVEFCC